VQSEFITHSGLQPSYGFPLYSGKQLHEPAPLYSLHIAFIPQGEGMHGFRGSWYNGSTIIIISKIILLSGDKATRRY